MLKIIRLLLQIVVLILASYSLLTKNFEFLPLTMFFVASLSFIVGLIELQRKKKINGYLMIIVSLFVFFVSIQGFILN
ncbi:DUF3953 domain-containing protein [Bacillus solitudinis]|uniref:DUF3953 domain-containing protein n=1 Tax=Bacillus solitudinis TaxID=2014074 RepID=UPI0018E20190|nr:DUF3953 domain-containing protein [Bacillus solitudinis]